MIEIVEAGPFVLELTHADGAVRAVRFVEEAANPSAGPESDAARRLRAYFAGDLEALRGAALLRSGTPFPRAVRDAVEAIPAGETRTYGEIARALGKPGAARAVGTANATNPLALFIPCHRVVGASGELTGYAWGLECKRWLLAHESRS